MTTSFITDQIDQELQITDLQSMNGGSAPLILGLGAAGGLMIGIAIDAVIEKETGKTILEHATDAVKSVLKPDQCEVAPTGDGKGCTNRDWPV